MTKSPKPPSPFTPSDSFKQVMEKPDIIGNPNVQQPGQAPNPMQNTIMGAPQNAAAQQQQNLTIPQALALAGQCQAQGKLQQAEQLLQQILQQQPNNAEALHLLGVVAHSAGNLPVAMQLIERAIHAKSDVALFHANLGEMYRLTDDLNKAVDYGKRAVALDPKLVSAHGNLGIAYFDQKNYDEAKSCHQAALQHNPSFAPSLNNLGSICRHQKENEEAITYYQRAIEANPHYLEPLNNLAATFTRMERPDEAMQLLDQVLAQHPNYPEAHCNRGFALCLLDREGEALVAFHRAIELKPDYTEAYHGLARIYKEQQELKKARGFAQKAIGFEPDNAEGHSILASIEMADGYADKARKSYNVALELDDECISATLGLGNILMEEGEFAEARLLFDQVIHSDNERISALFNMVNSGKVSADDDAVKMLLEEAESLEKMPESKQIFMHFALGKVHDDLGAHDKSFQHYIEGCRLKRKKLDYSSQQKQQQFETLKSIATTDYFDQLRGANNQPIGHRDNTPILVLGMPRSGTTLTEQIIASHPDVHGGGELFFLLELAKWKGIAGETLFPETMRDMTPDDFTALGQAYVEKLRTLNSDVGHITDKMPANFFHVGLLHLALPQAKIVHISRHPLDNCISCFTRLFAHNQNNTYDLTELGHFYRFYHELMAHWRSTLPQGAFYDIRYEDLVSNTEDEARKLLEYCELEWDDRCLEFYKTKRNIRTASVTQVRQPIYKTSVAKWKKYEAHLGPLIEALGPVLDDYEM